MVPLSFPPLSFLFFRNETGSKKENPFHESGKSIGIYKNPWEISPHISGKELFSKERVYT